MLAAATSGANAQGTLNVSASAVQTAPDWAAAGADESTTTLSASVSNPPFPGSGCTLNGPDWSWSLGQVQFSVDNTSWSQTQNGYSAWIVQPEPSLPGATLHVTFTEGGYWQIPCTAAVEYDTGTCGQAWSGNAVATALPKSVKLLGLTVTSGATQEDVTGTTSWAAVKTNAGDKVIAQASIQPDNQDAAAKIQWTNGSAVAGNAKQRSVDKGTSVETLVTAKIGSDQYSVDIWILWVTITNKMDGTTPPNAVQFGATYDATENLGAIAYDGGTVAVGKLVPIGKITPAGVHNIVRAGWTFRRDRWTHDFNDGVKDSAYFDNDWRGDDSDELFQVLTPDTNDQIYDRDAPNIASFGNKDSSETYKNFRQWIQWHLEPASDYGAWCFQGRWKVDQTPQITLKEIAQGAIALPATAHYPAP
jgi:hypothetical protein